MRRRMRRWSKEHRGHKKHTTICSRQLTVPLFREGEEQNLWQISSRHHTWVDRQWMRDMNCMFIFFSSLSKKKFLTLTCSLGCVRGRGGDESDVMWILRNFFNFIFLPTHAERKCQVHNLLLPPWHNTHTHSSHQTLCHVNCFTSLNPPPLVENSNDPS
jgi:hypothetical protein